MMNYERDHLKYTTRESSRRYENDEKVSMQRKE